jgi:hypothetical protein
MKMKKFQKWLREWLEKARQDAADFIKYLINPSCYLGMKANKNP